VAATDSLVVGLATETVDTLITIANTAVTDPDLSAPEAEKLLEVLDAGLTFVTTAKSKVTNSRGYPAFDVQPGEWTTKTAQLRHLIRVLRSVYGPQMVSSD
jgi:hypothetical protein